MDELAKAVLKRRNAHHAYRIGSTREATSTSEGRTQESRLRALLGLAERAVINAAEALVDADALKEARP